MATDAKRKEEFLAEVDAIIDCWKAGNPQGEDLWARIERLIAEYGAPAPAAVTGGA